MHRAVTSIAALGITVLLLGGCGDDPVAPGGDVASARVAGGDAPSGLSGWAPSDVQINLGWTDNSRNETGFEIHRSTGGSAGTFAIVGQTGANVTQYSDQGLTPSTEYCYKVRWVRKTGKTTMSEFSNVFCAYTLGPPPAPTGITTVPGATSWSTWIDVAWSQSTSLAQGFRVERSDSPEGAWTQIAQIASWARSHRDPNRPIEVQACYRVSALNSTYGNSAPSAPVCTAPPARPTELTPTTSATSSRTIDLTWKNNSAVADGYEVHRGSDPSSGSLVATLGAEATSYQDVGLPDGRHYYRVRARKSGGFSDFSDPASVLIATSPPASSPPIEAHVVGSTSVVLYWSAQPAGVEGYVVRRSIDNGAAWEKVAKVGAFGTSWWDHALTPEQRVCYQIAAYNSAGEGPPSNTDCVTPPAVVSDLRASPGGMDEMWNGVVDLEWTDPSRVNTGYSVEYLETGYDSYYGHWEYWVQHTTIGDVTAHRVTGLDRYKFYQFRLITLGPDGNSDPSAPAGSWTDHPPAAPSGLSATAVSTSQVDLRWTDNATNETEMVVERCEGSATWCAENSAFYGHQGLPENATAFSDTRVQPGATYSYRVTAYNGGAPSGPSNVVTVTIPPLLPE